MAGEPTLRSAVPGDVQQIAEVWHAGWRDGHLGLVPDELVPERTPESFLVRARERLGQTTVATVGEAVAGFVVVIGDELAQVYVAAGHRGTGVAAALMQEAERQVAAAGHAEAWLAVVPGNVRARAFYEKHGWRDDGPLDYAAETAGGTIAVPCRRYVKHVGRVG